MMIVGKIRILLFRAAANIAAAMTVVLTVAPEVILWTTGAISNMSVIKQLRQRLKWLCCTRSLSNIYLR